MVLLATRRMVQPLLFVANIRFDPLHVIMVVAAWNTVSEECNGLHFKRVYNVMI